MALVMQMYLSMMTNKLQTHSDFNELRMRAINDARKARNFNWARILVSQFRVIRKLQRQCGIN
jgi:hypothetical protein